MKWSQSKMPSSPHKKQSSQSKNKWVSSNCKFCFLCDFKLNQKSGGEKEKKLEKGMNELTAAAPNHFDRLDVTQATWRIKRNWLRGASLRLRFELSRSAQDKKREKEGKGSGGEPARARACVCVCVCVWPGQTSTRKIIAEKHQGRIPNLYEKIQAFTLKSDSWV